MIHLSQFLSIADLSRAQALALLGRAREMKRAWHDGHRSQPVLAGATLALVFEKPSLRTRVSFEAGMAQLGGHCCYLAGADISMGKRESVADVARNLSRWVQMIAARVFDHQTAEELAAHATVPVINALSDREHPCQALADMLTIEEHRGSLPGTHLAYVGDGNNVCHSLLLLAPLLGVHMSVACPPGYAPLPDLVAQARALAEEQQTTIQVTTRPEEAVAGADAVYTDVWTSMGQEAETEQRKALFHSYQLNAALLANAKADALVMHCLPAHRGEEITADVLEHTQSVVFDQAENRMHVQKALILTLLDL